MRTWIFLLFWAVMASVPATSLAQDEAAVVGGSFYQRVSCLPTTFSACTLFDVSCLSWQAEHLAVTRSTAWTSAPD